MAGGDPAELHATAASAGRRAAIHAAFGHYDGPRSRPGSGGASTAERYGYYRDLITRAGGVFLDHPGEINLLAIGGVARPRSVFLIEEISERRGPQHPFRPDLDLLGRCGCNAALSLAVDFGSKASLGQHQLAFA